MTPQFKWIYAKSDTLIAIGSSKLLEETEKQQNPMQQLVFWNTLKSPSVPKKKCIHRKSAYDGVRGARWQSSVGHLATPSPVAALLFKEVRQMTAIVPRHAMQPSFSKPSAVAVVTVTVYGLSFYITSTMTHHCHHHHHHLSTQTPSRHINHHAKF